VFRLPDFFTYLVGETGSGKQGYNFFHYLLNTSLKDIFKLNHTQPHSLVIFLKNSQMTIFFFFFLIYFTLFHKYVVFNKINN